VLLVGICGSSASSRRTRALIESALEGAQSVDNDINVDIIDLSILTLDFCDGRPIEEYNHQTQLVLAKIEQADGYLFGTPMYRGTMTGAMKNLIDLIPDQYVKGKAAGLIATGGSDHHYLGLDLGFRTAMAFFQIHTIPGALYYSRFTVENGRIVEDKVRGQSEQFGQDLVQLVNLTVGKALGPSLY
jgi:NAD(P)H-dependent FMN reductase